MVKKLIDKARAYEIYFELGTSRSLSKLHEQISRKYPKNSPSYPTLKNWSKAGNWVEKCLIRDKEINQGVQEKMMPEWIETKAYLLKVALEQVKKGRDAGVVPASTRDMMAAIKEARSIMGESDKLEVSGSVNVSLNETLKEYENVLKRITASDPAEDDS
jgi:hypothetical protein